MPRHNNRIEKNKLFIFFGSAIEFELPVPALGHLQAHTVFVTLGEKTSKTDQNHVCTPLHEYPFTLGIPQDRLVLLKFTGIRAIKLAT